MINNLSISDPESCSWKYADDLSLSETVARILQPYNIRVAHKPIFTLRRLLTDVKGKDKPEDRPGAVYKIHCSDCHATYIGETGRNLTTRLTEHKRATKRVTSTIGSFSNDDGDGKENGTWK